MSEPITAMIWHRSRRCGNSGCVEVAFQPSTVLLRDAKDPTGPSLTIPRNAWASFLDAVRDGHFDVPNQ